MKEDMRTVLPAPMLLPRGDGEKWAVVACDQFTSEPKYWQALDAFVGDAPSALRLILPECFLGERDAASRQEKIPETMHDYLRRGIFTQYTGYISVRRTFASGGVRRGLMAMIDLAAYDYRAGTAPRIRATEGTVESRLPPRVAIRAASPLELPHIMLLADDPENRIFRAVTAQEGDTLYDFDLSGGGGHITGKAVRDPSAIDTAFDLLAGDMQARFTQDLLLLVGDGNHSLAAAKNCYEQAKAAGDPSAERKRYALCEIVSLYDEGIVFHPIHRAIFGVRPDDFAEKLAAAGAHFPRQKQICGGGKTYTVHVPADIIAEIAFVQTFSESYVKESGGEIDYIHGDDVLASLSARPDCMTVAFDPISKDGFTEYILAHGALPKKTFSMGEAAEKRYYLEARRID